MDAVSGIRLRIADSVTLRASCHCGQAYTATVDYSVNVEAGGDGRRGSIVFDLDDADALRCVTEAQAVLVQQATGCRHGIAAAP